MTMFQPWVRGNSVNLSHPVTSEIEGEVKDSCYRVERTQEST